MGLEAESELITAGDSVHVKALLESDALILRGAVKKTLPRAEISDPRAVGEQLLFEHHGTPYALALPDGQAVKWAKKLNTAPPSLAAKLGVDATHKVVVWGKSDDSELASALAGAVTDDPAQATQGLVIALTPDDLPPALSHLTQVLPNAAIWIVYPKGAKSALPESTVRDHLRALGFIDTKACAVSQTLTATRFSPRKAVLPTA